MTDLHQRLSAWQHHIRVAMATSVLDLPFASCIITGDLPDVYEHNLMVVTRPAPAYVVQRSVDRIADTVGWRYRRIEIDDDQIAAALGASLLAAGYTQEQMVTMALAGPLTPGTAPDMPTAVVGVDDHAELARAINAEQPWAPTAAVLDQLAARERRLSTVADLRVVVAPPDAPVSRCLLLTDGTLFEIDSVDTLVDHRGQGWSRAVMRRAIAEAIDANAEHVVLVADDDDWPRDWYGRLGFEVVGRSTAFRRYPRD